MNKLHVMFPLISLLAFLCVAVPAEVVGQITVFQNGFEYNEEPIVFEPSDLNGAIDQVGLWSGLEFPEGIGDLAPDTVGFVDNPYGGRGLFLDRPTGDDGSGIWPNVEPNGDFTGSYFADLEESVLLLGAEVSFDVATRRGSGNDNKSWDIIGRDTNGSESFHLRVSTNNTVWRLGTITDGGDTINFDLPTTVGEDMRDDLPNIGAADSWTTASGIGSVNVLMGADGYVINFAHNPLRPNGNAYTTEVIGYNGQGVDLAQVEFTYQASSATGRNTGAFLDNVLVTGNKEILEGDFNGDGSIDLADFLVLSGNFNQPGDLSTGDINFDGNVDLFDFFQWREVFNQPAGAAAANVPEPGTGFLLGLGCVAFTPLMRRRASRTKKDLYSRRTNSLYDGLPRPSRASNCWESTALEGHRTGCVAFQNTLLAFLVGICLLVLSGPSTAQDFVLSVNRGNGETTVANTGAGATEVDGYSIDSANGLLNPAGWTSLASQGVEGWTVANPTARQLTELNLPAPADSMARQR